MRLGVNIDHVATLRNARGGMHPSITRAAKIVEDCGADLVVVHLREDRRHIKEDDITYIMKNIKIPLQLEIAPNNFMFNYSIKNNLASLKLIPVMTVGSIPLVFISWFVSYFILVEVFKSYNKRVSKRRKKNASGG